MNDVLIPKNRIQSIDLLRGIVMIIMALDHTREYFHADALRFDADDLSQTSPALFFSRWITHFCAPVFVFLAGTSAFLSSQRKTKKQLSLFLLKRGLWLLLLEVTIVSFAWSFNIKLHFTGLQVIWALGISMIALAALIQLSRKIIFVIGILIITCHNLLDNLHYEGFIWAALHEPKLFHINNTHVVRITYPVLPWIGIMALGYCFGNIYTKAFAEKRRKLLLSTGISLILLFCLIRAINIYGDPHRWAIQDSSLFTFLSFFNTTKYPPSFLYILMTLGPSFVFLALTDRSSGKFVKAINHIGRVPLFYYIMHLYLIHLLAMVAAELSPGFSWHDMILHYRPWLDPQLKGYGFSLEVTYLVWIIIVLTLFPLCKWYDKYKTAHKEKWWLSYL